MGTSKLVPGVETVIPDRKPAGQTAQKLRNSALRCRRWAHRIDLMSRVVIPATIVGFTSFYFVMYDLFDKIICFN